MKDITTTQYHGSLEFSDGVPDREKEVVRVLQHMYNDYKDRRQTKTTRILACWAAYLGTPRAETWRRNEVLTDTQGDVGKDWRHRINRGKAYEIVENIVPYLKMATFPNDDWFDMMPLVPIDDPQYEMYLKLMKAYMQYKLYESKFKDKWELFLRQLVITGTSILSLPWRVETKTKQINVKVEMHGQSGYRTETIEKTFYNAPDIGVEDVLDFYLDPDGCDPNTSNIIRRVVLTRGQISRLVQEGCYTLPPEYIWKLKPYKLGRSEDQETVQDFLGIDQRGYSMGDSIEIFEFWGDLGLRTEELRDVVITWCGDQVLRMENNPYWEGKPFIIGTYTQIMNSPYGFGALEPVLGDIHELDIISNVRLDSEEVSLMPTWLVTNDGTVDPNELFIEPGKVIPVADVNSVRSLAADLRFVNVSISEEQLREQTVDRRTATGAFIGTAEGRGGERVTAAEVNATREAGGNRLSGVYEHIELTALLPALTLIYNYARQFVVKDELVPFPGKHADEILYATVGIDQLHTEFRLIPKGATHIADKEYELRQMTDWVSLMGSNQQLAQNVNWTEVAKELTRRFIGFHPERFIQEQQADPTGGNPMAQVAEQAGAVGGNELKNYAQGQLSADGGQNMMQPLLDAMPQQPVNVPTQPQ
jgi:hypothetical protein